MQVQCDARVTGHSRAATAWTARGYRLPLLWQRGIHSFVWGVKAALIGSSSLSFRDTLLFPSSRVKLLEPLGWNG